MDPHDWLQTLVQRDGVECGDTSFIKYNHKMKLSKEEHNILVDVFNDLADRMMPLRGKSYGAKELLTGIDKWRDHWINILKDNIESKWQTTR